MEFSIENSNGEHEEGKKGPKIKGVVIGHYYGDLIRRLFIAGGSIMILTLPFFKEIIPIPIFFSIFSIVIIGVFAGLTNPRQKWVNILNAIISAVAFVTFEYFAVNIYTLSGDYLKDLFFWTNQTLAIIFFVALYFGAKTVRGFYYKN